MEKKHISLISFFTIFNNIKGRKNKKDKKYWTYIRIRGRERHNKKEKHRGAKLKTFKSNSGGGGGGGGCLFFLRKKGSMGEK